MANKHAARAPSDLLLPRHEIAAVLNAAVRAAAGYGPARGLRAAIAAVAAGGGGGGGGGGGAAARRRPFAALPPIGGGGAAAAVAPPPVWGDAEMRAQLSARDRGAARRLAGGSGMS